MPNSIAQSRGHFMDEANFLLILNEGSEDVVTLAEALEARASNIWHKRHFFQLLIQFEGFESLLDDYGAKHNQTFSFLRELAASIRGFAFSGYSLNHMAGRMESYGVLDSLEIAHYSSLEGHLANVRGFIQESVLVLLRALTSELTHVGVTCGPSRKQQQNFEARGGLRQLPHNLGEEDPGDEVARIAEVASRFLGAAGDLSAKGFKHIADETARHEYLTGNFNEEQSRVFEAAVHNLQSFYDTHIKHTSASTNDNRLPQLRGLASVTLHMLEAATALTHFCERHEGNIQGVETERRLNQLVGRSEVEERILNHLLVPAVEVMQSGASLSQALLADSTNAQELTVTLPEGLLLHARPAALIVRIASHHGTPVELQVQDKSCNAASILEVLVCVGSFPGQRKFTFRGDEKPLGDIEALFENGLGELGLECMPPRLAYLSQGY